MFWLLGDIKLGENKGHFDIHHSDIPITRARIHIFIASAYLTYDFHSVTIHHHIFILFLLLSLYPSSSDTGKFKKNGVIFVDVLKAPSEIRPPWWA